MCEFRLEKNSVMLITPRKTYFLYKPNPSHKWENIKKIHPSKDLHGMYVSCSEAVFDLIVDGIRYRINQEIGN